MLSQRTETRTSGPSLTFAALVAVALFVHASAAYAQFGECPTEARDFGPINGSFGNSHAADVLLPATMHPCETFWIEISAAYTPGGPSSAIGASARNSSGGAIGMSVGINGSAILPKTSDVLNWPTVDGTLDHSMRLVSVWIVAGNATDQFPVNYSVTFHLTPRPGFNRGGLSFAEAPQTFASDIIKMSLPSNAHPTGKQYFKLTLGQMQSVRFTGLVSNRHQSSQSTVNIALYDAVTLDSAALLTGMKAPAASVDAPFSTKAFTNTSSEPKDYYVLFQVNSSVPLHAGIVTVRVFELKLFLESDSSPNGGGATYLPGSESSGISKAVPASGSIEDIVAVAAYVESDGTVVPPPTTGTVSFKLSSVSAFAGMAMNLADPRESGGSSQPDITITTAGSTSCTPAPAWCLSTSFDNGDNTARVSLGIWDYGGFGTVSVTQGTVTGKPMRLPRDTDSNWLPDAGWKFFANGAEYDAPGTGTTPTANETDGGPGTSGDGLASFEEFRGFVVRGVHRRTNPMIKDLFVESEADVDADVGGQADADVNIGAAINLPINKHRVLFSEMDGARRINPLWQNSGWGGSLAVHTNQKGLRVTVAHLNEDFLGLTMGSNPNNVQLLEVYLGQIRKESPPSSDDHVVEGPDADGLKKVIGHEVGHAVGIRHYCLVPHPNDPACLVEQRDPHTVMVSGLAEFASITGDPAWLNIPEVYDATDGSQIAVH
jgi:hypothetical protein